MLGWHAFLKSRGCDSIIASHNVGFLHLESLTVVSEGLIMLLAQAKLMGRVILDPPIGGVRLREDKC